MAAATWLRPQELSVPTTDARMILPGVTFREYVILRELLDTRSLRMTYCEGVLELMTTSRMHELWKKTVARLVETYAFLTRLPLIGYGSTTFKREATLRGAEADECWCVGRIMKEGETPDIVLEVIVTNPILDKLHVYEGLEVPEVWLWREGKFELYRRRAEGGYDVVDRSALVPSLDFALVAPFAGREDQDVALREFAEVVAAAHR
jgi:Uma2 family endonuclease